MSKAQRAGLPYVLTGDSQVVAKELRGSPDTRPYVTAWMVAPSDRHVFLKFLTAGIAKAACDPSGVIAGIVERRLGINTSTQDTGA